MTQTVEHAPEPTDTPSPSRGGNGVGIAAFVTGALWLAPLALVLGIVGLARYRAGKASRRSWPLAGAILGAVGMVAGAVLGVLYVASDAPAARQDAFARVDAINVGNAVVDWYVAHPDGGAPTLTSEADGYTVDGVPLAAELEFSTSARQVSLAGDGPYGWCLSLVYAGGHAPEAGFSATEGLVDSCPAA